MRPDPPDECAFDTIMREAWRTIGAEGSAPLTVRGFRDRLADLVESVLVDSYFDEMRETRNRLNEVSSQVATSAVEQRDVLRRGQVEALALVAQGAAVSSVRLSAAMMLDLVEGHVRQVGDPPVGGKSP